MRRSLLQLAGISVLTFSIVVIVAARTHQAQTVAAQMNPDKAVEAARIRDKAIDAVRLINAAEYDYRKSFGHFAAWPEVYGSSAVRNLLQTWPKINELSIAPSDEVIPGFRLTLLVGEEGAAYSVALREMKGNGCGISVFSDQSGLIYEGKIVDCPEIVDHPGAVVR
jgi:hypothetical protein